MSFTKFTSIALALLVCSLAAPGQEQHYRGKPFHDSIYHGGPQKIPGRVQCAYHDLGRERVAYHDADAKNRGSGGLSPADGTYLNQFRMGEGVDTSYTKFHRDVEIDDNPYNLAKRIGRTAHAAEVADIREEKHPGLHYRQGGKRGKIRGEKNKKTSEKYLTND